MISNKFKWIVIHEGIAEYFDHKPKKVPYGYMTKHGRKIIGRDIVRVSRKEFERSRRNDI